MQDDTKNSSLSYQSSGVDLDRADAVSEHMKKLLPKTFRKGSVPLPGGFAALFDMQREGKAGEMLVLSTDGIGTKIKLGVEHGHYHALGIDLVAMSVNDVLTLGADPLCFLDYVAFSDFADENFKQFMNGVADGCMQAGAALMGGETAEMPDIYQKGDFDAAGFCLASVHPDKRIDGSRIEAGDLIVGLTSSGVHSNGFSLVRKIVDRAQDAQAWIPKLLAPTRIYVRCVQAVMQAIDVHGMVHVTGGGLVGNTERIVPEGLCAQIDRQAWQVPELFNWLQKTGEVDSEEMYRVFNMGIGYLIVCRPKDESRLVKTVNAMGSADGSMQAITVGKVVPGESRAAYC